MLAITSTFLIADNVDQQKLFEEMDIIQLKAMECISNGSTNVTFKQSGFLIGITYSKDIEDLETEDKYCLIVKNEETEEE